MKWKTTTTAMIVGDYGSWSVSDGVDANVIGFKAQLRTVRLTIDGVVDEGYHLSKDPDGHFAADDWFTTHEEALAAAREDFGVEDDDWTAVNNDSAAS